MPFAKYYVFIFLFPVFVILSCKNEFNDKKAEIHLLMLWEQARPHSKDVISDIEKHAKIRAVFEIKWDERHFQENLQRFYLKNATWMFEKMRRCGMGTMLAVILQDDNPQHDLRKTSAGNRMVNTMLFDKKQEYRKWAGQGSYVDSIHTTVTKDEAEHDIMMLFGKNPADLVRDLPNNWNGTVLEHHKNLAGSEGFSSLSSLFYFLNSTTKYVVLRGWEQLPNEQALAEHEDIDVLFNVEHFEGSLNGEEQIQYTLNSVNKKVRVGHRDVSVDYRWVGDNYFDKLWQKQVLESRKIAANGIYVYKDHSEHDRIYVPDLEGYFWTLLYHVLIQKKKSQKTIFPFCK